MKVKERVDAFSEGRYRASWQALVDAQKAFESISYMGPGDMEMEQGAVLQATAAIFCARLQSFLEYEKDQIENHEDRELERLQKLSEAA